jgi:hypothetical protein
MRKTHRTRPWSTAALALIAILSHGSAQAAAGEPSFAEFDRRARAGDPLNVVFFGASLTWGGQRHGPGVDLLPRTNEGAAGGTLSQDAIPVL